ncbi:MAG: outer membrane beta-barrel protein [Pseudomonadales bacterium]
MKQHTLAALIGGALLTFAAHGATAADMGFYLGGSLGISFIETEDQLNIGDRVEDFDIDDDDFAWKAFIGFQFLPWLGIEGGYVDFGDVQGATPGGVVTTEVDGWNLFAVATLPVGPIDVFAKLGVIWWNVDIDFADQLTDLDDTSISNDGSDVAYGVGAAFNFDRFAVRAELELFDVDDVDDVYMLSVGAVLRF